MLFPGQLLARGGHYEGDCGRERAPNAAVPADPFMILLKGHYKPLVNPPNLSLTKAHLNDGSYSTVKIYPARGVPGHTDQSKAIGNFYVQFAGDLCAYNLPKGSLAMRFDKVQPPGETIPDGSGGNWLVGNANLTILEGTGIYRSFVGGHNFMVDILHQLADQSYVENCVCIIQPAITRHGRDDDAGKQQPAQVRSGKRRSIVGSLTEAEGPNADTPSAAIGP